MQAPLQPMPGPGKALRTFAGDIGEGVHALMVRRCWHHDSTWTVHGVQHSSMEYSLVKCRR